MSSSLPSLLRILGALVGVYLLFGGVVFLAQRSLLYHPTHRAVDTLMERWEAEGEYWGYRRAAAQPAGVWLILHGNGGQAAHRDYLLEQLADDVSVYVLEYPGYGDRPGLTTEENINEAAARAWRHLRDTHPDLPMGVIGESIGSGPAAWLAGASEAPDKIVLLVPFDRLHRVAAARFWWLPVKWLMRDDWDNVAALAGFGGELEIYAAAQDEIIPVERARALAAAYPAARWEVMEGGHNTWQWNQPFALPRRPDVAAIESTAVE